MFALNSVTSSRKSFHEARSHVEKLLNYTFANENLLLEALYAGGLALIGGRAVKEANKRLALVGDRAMDLILAHEDYGNESTRGTPQY